MYLAQAHLLRLRHPCHSFDVNILFDLVTGNLFSDRRCFIVRKNDTPREFFIPREVHGRSARELFLEAANTQNLTPTK